MIYAPRLTIPETGWPGTLFRRATMVNGATGMLRTTNQVGHQHQRDRCGPPMVLPADYLAADHCVRRSTLRRRPPRSRARPPPEQLNLAAATTSPCSSE